MNEFDVIEKYFAPLSKDGLDNDAAVLPVREGHELVVTSDTLNAGIHFPAQASPKDIAHKALRCNLSDLASMGAESFAYQLNMAFPDKPQEDWLAAFTAALAEDQKTFEIFCSGGDTTSTSGPLSISITAMGWVKKGLALVRSGAQKNHSVVLTGPVGDAYIGLQVLEGKIETPDGEYFIEKYYRPHPHLELRHVLREYAHAVIDVSDGLVADAGHICKASGVAAELRLADMMFSAPAQKLIDAGIVKPEDLITGGDDYELVLAMPPLTVEKATIALGALKITPQVIGSFTAGDGTVCVLDSSGRPVDIKHTGWSHF